MQLIPLELRPLSAKTTWQSDCQVNKPLRVALVNMPWARTDAPSIQCGLLKAGLTRFGHQVDVLYPNLELAAELGPQLYDAVTNAPSERVHLFGEWLFGHAAFPEQRFDLDGAIYGAEFPEVVQLCAEAGLSWKEVCRLRTSTVPGWTTRQYEAVAWTEYDLIGFTSTFVQNVASIALARRIKESHPQALIVAGGANYDGCMGPEFIRALPWLDYAVVGEGDITLPRLAAAIANGKPVLDVPGVCGRDATGNVQLTPLDTLVRDLDDVPPPDFTEYFERLDRLGRRAVLGAKPPRLLVELSRGCWWGEKHHCTFCGLNALGMPFRSRHPAQAIRHLETLMRRHRVRKVDAVDNIVDMRYLTTLCAELAAAPWQAELFFEVKANLTRSQVQTLARSGVRQIQPGLESLSTHVLELMRKGSTKLLNIRLLKWARYYGVRVSWNLLTGFPGETDADYADQVTLAPLLTHLEPPDSFSRIWLERFSPYFTDPSLGIEASEPRTAYRLAYPLRDINHRDIAYFFDYPSAGSASPDTLSKLADAIAEWKHAWASSPRPELVYFRGPGWVILRDTRPATSREATLEGWQAEVLLSCDNTARTADRVHRDLLSAPKPPEVSVDEVALLLDRLVTQGVCVEEDGRYLSLALPARQPGG